MNTYPHLQSTIPGAISPWPAHVQFTRFRVCVANMLRMGSPQPERKPACSRRVLNLHKTGLSRRSRTKAFSLVEIVLAIGIVSFAFVAIFGLLPVGMTTFRQAMDTTVSSQIVQRVVNEAQQTDFSTLTANAGTPQLRYFDEQGNEVPSQNDYIYTVQVTVTPKTALPNAGSSENLATIAVMIASNPGHNPSPFAATSKLPVSYYAAYVARNQQ